MPELRQDPLSGRWVVMATGRAKRPEAFVPLIRPADPPAFDPACPFCPGNEGMTPAEVAADRPAGAPADSPGWTLRVVPNKYAAFDGAAGWGETPASPLERRQPAYGAAEVIIETARHDRTLARATDAEIVTVLDAYRARYRTLAARPGYECLLLFRNYGTYAGASQEHPHSQIIAMSSVPPAISTELDRAAAYQREHGRCLLCDMIGRERAIGERMVYDDGDWVVFAPYASRSPFELMLLPSHHHADVATLPDAALPGLARALGLALRTLERALHDPPFNYFLHSVPPGLRGQHAASYHWHLTLLPRLTQQAAFELGTGTLINITLPEAAAAFLRDHR